MTPTTKATKAKKFDRFGSHYPRSAQTRDYSIRHIPNVHSLLFSSPTFHRTLPMESCTSSCPSWTPCVSTSRRLICQCIRIFLLVASAIPMSPSGWFPSFRPTDSRSRPKSSKGHFFLCESTCASQKVFHYQLSPFFLPCFGIHPQI